MPPAAGGARGGRIGSTGIHATGNASIDVWNSRFSGFGTAGIYGDATDDGKVLQVSVSDSSFTASYAGVVMEGSGATAIARGTVVRSSFSNSAYGVLAQAFTLNSSAVASVANNMFSGITTSAVGTLGGGTIETLSNNTARNNGANGTAVGVSSF